MPNNKVDPPPSPSLNGTKSDSDEERVMSYPMEDGIYVGESLGFKAVVPEEGDRSPTPIEEKPGFKKWRGYPAEETYDDDEWHYRDEKSVSPSPTVEPVYSKWPSD